MRALLLSAAIISGCFNGSNEPASPSQPGSSGAESAPAAKYLCVGMETSKRFGACPGCALDASRLSGLLDGLGYKGDTLVSDRATKAKVVSLLKKGIADTKEDGLFLFLYSGHGGQEALGGQEPDGADQEDEYLCLYDAHMLDDEIWEIVSHCKGRVFLYFDACHSATMYRSVGSELKVSAGQEPVAKALSADMVKSSGFTLRPEKFSKARAMSAGAKSEAPKILCWSGCKESEYSYGSDRGGELTLAVVSNWKKGISYGDLWNKASSKVNSAMKTQNPVQTSIGGFSVETEAFK